jgi:hypothetical protein
MKQASVLDELLLTVAAPPNALRDRKIAEDKKIDELTKKYHNAQKELDETHKIADSLKDIEKSNMTKEMRILEAPLQTRSCPDHSGVQMARVGDDLWQCELDKKTYSYSTGYTLNDGTKVPGSEVANQTQGLDYTTHSIFDTREGRLNSSKL